MFDFGSEKRLTVHDAATQHRDLRCFTHFGLQLLCKTRDRFTLGEPSGTVDHGAGAWTWQGALPPSPV